MTQQPLEPPTPSSPLSEAAATELLEILSRKQGTWVDWGRACQQLHKAGYKPDVIFEQTGFQAVQQNQIGVAAQVFDSIVKAGASDEVQSYYTGPRADVLYELRILNQERRFAAAQLAMEKRLEAETAREVARAFQEFSLIAQIPAGFVDHPGDALACQCWKTARQKKDLQERSRLIAKGLKFAHSATAREQIEKLLSDFTVVGSRSAPLMPIYRVEAEDELPRIISVIGSLPLPAQAIDNVPKFEETEPFRIANFPGGTAVAPIPGWQVILKAKTPVGILCSSHELPTPIPGKPEAVLVIIDLDQTQWDANSYFLVAPDNNLAFKWFETPPETPILGQVVLVMRPKKIFDENAITEPWQIDE
ncbi:MAG TPA: hypothetical protein IGS52_13940 [Oscillatoriaceae cyanobacterium M33_DOE_052]|uniref:RuBisCO accumulation factor 1 n=1 Tax=Planktothricoides sp. SpSt-374 TaxID=2282167 RepID=A0A7C3ZUB8_9CYAN|nr:hypothetical protein [Oscillatoriaceae cyanobacterium M33_DOE_052]